MAGIEGVKVMASDQSVLAIGIALLVMVGATGILAVLIFRSTNGILKGAGGIYTLLTDLKWRLLGLEIAQRKPEISFGEASSSLVPVEADKSDGKGVIEMKWFRVGVNEKGEAEVVKPEERRRPYHGRRGRHGHNKRPTLNKLTEKDIAYIMAKEHRCPRCGILMVYIGLTKSRALEAVVLACPNCNHREGYSRLSYRELRVF